MLYILLYGCYYTRNRPPIVMLVVVMMVIAVVNLLFYAWSTAPSHLGADAQFFFSELDNPQRKKNLFFLFPGYKTGVWSSMVHLWTWYMEAQRKGTKFCEPIQKFFDKAVKFSPFSWSQTQFISFLQFLSFKIQRKEDSCLIVKGFVCLFRCSSKI